MKAFLISIFLSGLLMAPAMAGGAAYGTRDPATCSVRTVPASGPPSTQQAAQYLACEIEHEASQMMYLLGNLTIRVAPQGRTIDPKHDSAYQADTSKPVYDISGSFRKYQCPTKTSLAGSQHPGSACSYADETNASGLCFQNTMGDWHCLMKDAMHLSNSVEFVPPPN